MNFNTEFEAQQYGHKIGATHYKINDIGSYSFIKESGALNPIIPFGLIGDYMEIKDQFQRVVTLAHQCKEVSDLLWFDSFGEWLAVSCDWISSGLLRDDVGVKKLELNYNK